MRMTTLRSLLACLAAAAGTALAAPFAYVPHDGGVAVIDVGGRAHSRDIALPRMGSMPVATGAAAFLLESTRGYVAASDRIHVIDIRAQTAVTWVDLPGVDVVTRNPERPRAYAATVSGGNSTFHVINTGNNAFSSRPMAGVISRIAFNRAGTRAYLTNETMNRVEVIDARNDTAIATIPTGVGPRGVVAHPTLNRLYVANFGAGIGNTVSVINLDSNTIVTAIPVGAGASDLAITPTGARLLVTNRGSNSVSIIDTRDNRVIGTVGVGPSPEGIDIDPEGAEAYVVNTAGGTVSLVSTDTMRVTRTLNIGNNVRAIGRFIGGPTPTPPELPGVLTGLWWRSTEPGWGLHLTSRGSNIFAVWFNYAVNGDPRWYVSSNCEFDPPLPCPTCFQEAVCSGRVFEFTGPPFIGRPFRSDLVQGTDVGEMQLKFFDQNRASFTYEVRGRSRATPIERQLFARGPVANVDYTDLYWNPGESGWGLGVTHQGNVMFLTWFIYDDEGRAQWMVASNCMVNAAGNGCSGALYVTRGPPGPTDASGFDSSQVLVTEVGRVELSFSDSTNGTLSYRIGDVGVTKAITRQFF